MNIFEKRPLSLILCIGLGGFLLFSFDNRILRIGLLTISVLLGILSLILKIDKRKRILCALVGCSILVASALSFLYFDTYFRAYDIYEGENDIVGTVEQVSESSSYNLRLLVRVESINGEGGKGYKFYAYTSKADAKGVIEGTRVSFKATLDGFSDESYTYNVSRGINSYASDVRDLTILEYTNGSISMQFARVREYLTRYIMKMSNADTGAIISALLLGERDYLPDQLRLDFRRIGISHILALSGMHLAILSLGIGKALTLLKVRKKTRVCIIAIFVMLYMALTGFSVSVVRAGLMLIISSVLFLLSRTKDTLTSLSVAVFIICLITPNAIMDVSLWLSALATFGIIAYGEITASLPKPKSIRNKILSYIALGILASIFAISATMLVSTLTFGGISILAPITTIIFSLLAEAIMYLGCIMMLIGWLIPVGWLITPLCKVMTLLAGAFSEIRLSYVSSSFSFVTIAVIIYTLVFVLFLILKLKRPKKALNFIVILYAVVSLMPTVATAFVNKNETVAYYSDYKCDQMLIRSKNEVCLINSAQYSKNLAYTSLDFLEDANVTYLDKYYLTHYSWSIDDEIEVLMYNVSVDKIYIPAPRNEDEETILKILYKTVRDCRTEIVVFQPYETVTVDDYTINLLYSEPYGSTSMNAFTVARGDTVYTYISSGLLSGSTRERFERYISLTDHLILGEHGKKYKDRVDITECYDDLDSIIIHSANVFLTQNNMKYYLERNCNILSHPISVIYYTK